MIAPSVCKVADVALEIIQRFSSGEINYKELTEEFCRYAGIEPIEAVQLCDQLYPGFSKVVADILDGKNDVHEIAVTLLCEVFNIPMYYDELIKALDRRKNVNFDLCYNGGPIKQLKPRTKDYPRERFVTESTKKLKRTLVQNGWTTAFRISQIYGISRDKVAVYLAQLLQREPSLTCQIKRIAWGGKTQVYYSPEVIKAFEHYFVKLK